jgi:hypothetical protein
MLMGRLTPKLVERIRELYAEYGSYKKVAEELNLDWRTVKKHVEQPPAEPSKPPASAKAFQIFDEGGTPVDVVKEGVAEPEEAEELYKQYKRLKGLQPPQSLEEALRQVDLRLKKIEQHERELNRLADVLVKNLSGAKAVIESADRLAPTLEKLAGMSDELKLICRNIPLLQMVADAMPALTLLKTFNRRMAGQ